MGSETSAIGLRSPRELNSGRNANAKRHETETKAKWGRARRWLTGLALYPALAAVYAVARIAAGNVSYIRASEVVAAIAVFGMVGFAVNLAIFALARRWLGASRLALVTLVILAWLFNAEAVADQGLWIGLRSRSALIGISMVAVLACVWLSTTRRPLNRVSRGARALAFALPLMALMEFAVRRVRTGRLERSEFLAQATKPLPRPAVAASKWQGDVYLLFLDNYANSMVLASRYGVDDTPFRDSLATLGLTVATRGRSNYGFTAPSIGSMLSADHVQSLEQDPKASRAPWDALFAVVKRSRVLGAFKTAGYQPYVIQSAFFEGTQTSEVAQIYVPRSNRSLFVRFARLPLTRAVTHETIPGRAAERAGWVLIPASVELAPFEGMVELASVPGRKVVVGHSLIAHGPFVFDRDCRRDRNRSDDSTMYIAAVRCTHRQVLRTIRGIRARDPSAAILVMADHGPMPEGIEHVPAEDITPDQAAERFGAFRATLLPPGIDIPDSATHVNVIRRALGAILGIDLPDVPDRSYWSSLVALEHFVAVDSLVAHADRSSQRR